MNITTIFKTYSRIIVLSILIGALTLSTAYAAPPAQDPRPPVNPDSGGDSSADDDDDDGQLSSECGALMGQIINWGNGPQGDVLATLSSGSWEVSAMSATDGQFGFGGLGVGLATLEVPRASRDALQPTIQDAVVYLSCDYPVVANVALASVSEIEPPATIEISAQNQTVAADAFTRMTLTVQNDLPNDISNVLVTTAVPDGLIALNASMSTDEENTSVQIINGGDDGQVVVGYLEKLTSEEEAQIFVSLRAIEDTAVTETEMVATLFYRESAAHQARIDFDVDGSITPFSSSSNVSVTTAVQSSSANDDTSPSEDVTEVGFETQEEETVTVVEEDASTTTTEPDEDTAVAEDETAAESEDNSASEFLLPTTGKIVEQDEETSQADEFLLPTTGQDTPVKSIPVDTATPEQETSPTTFISLSLLIVICLAFGLASARRRPLEN